MMKEIEDIKNWLLARTSGELILLIAMMFSLVGLTAGYLIGQYQTSEKIIQDLKDHVLVFPENLTRDRFFSIDGEYLYYIVKTNITLQQYYQNPEVYK